MKNDLLQFQRGLEPTALNLILDQGLSPVM
jgi:hypothetical protein